LDIAARTNKDEGIDVEPLNRRAEQERCQTKKSEEMGAGRRISKDTVGMV
jgi:hypothetical protein